MDKCPFCGAPQIGRAHSGPKRKYACGSWLPGDREDRTRDCYESELATLKGLIYEIITNEVCLCASDSENCYIEQAKVRLARDRLKAALGELEKE